VARWAFFVKPWKMLEHDESFEIQDAAGRPLSFVYFEDDPTRGNFSRRFAKADARTMRKTNLSRLLARPVVALAWRHLNGARSIRTCSAAPA
jgi:hypothetical protein